MRSSRFSMFPSRCAVSRPERGLGPRSFVAVSPQPQTFPFFDRLESLMPWMRKADKETPRPLVVPVDTAIPPPLSKVCRRQNGGQGLR